METTEFNRSGVALMGWNYNGQDLNTVYFNGNVVFRKRLGFEDFWQISFSDRANVTSAYQVDVTDTNSPIVFTNISGAANVGNIKINALQVWGTNSYSSVGDNFSWNSSGTNVNIAANGTYSFEGIEHTSIEDEFYYDGSAHGKYPYSGTLNGATAYRIQFIYTDSTTSTQYTSSWYEFGSQYYYDPIESFEQGWLRGGDLNLTFTIAEPSGTYDLGDEAEGILYITNTNPYPASIEVYSVTSGVVVEHSLFEDIVAGETVQTNFSYIITENDILDTQYGGLFKNIQFGATAIASNGSEYVLEPVEDDGGNIWECNVEVAEPNPYVDISIIATSEPANGEAYVVGEEIEYLVTITNSGNVTIEEGTVTIELSGDEWPFDNLLPGDSITNETSYKVVPGNAIAGSVFAVAEVSGIAVTGDTIENEHEDEKPIVSRYTLTVNYYTQNLDGTFTKQTASTFTNVYNYGEYYTVTSPNSSGVFTGRTPDQARVTGQITEDTVIDVYYTLIPYTLTINYIFIDGATAYSPSYQGTYYYEQPYSVTSPTVSGYTPDPVIVSGGMPARDVIYSVIYRSNPTI